MGTSKLRPLGGLYPEWPRKQARFLTIPKSCYLCSGMLETIAQREQIDSSRNFVNFVSSRNTCKGFGGKIIGLAHIVVTRPSSRGTPMLSTLFGMLRALCGSASSLLECTIHNTGSDNDGCTNARVFASAVRVPILAFFVGAPSPSTSISFSSSSS